MSKLKLAIPTVYSGSRQSTRVHATLTLDGTILGMIFGASSLYLVLKVGLTVSASIPVAVIAITLFRLGHKFGAKDSSILENSIAQTAGSAGESLALRQALPCQRF